MGVKDLWKILDPAGRPISPEHLQGLVLSVGKLVMSGHNGSHNPF